MASGHAFQGFCVACPRPWPERDALAKQESRPGPVTGLLMRPTREEADGTGDGFRREQLEVKPAQWRLRRRSPATPSTDKLVLHQSAVTRPKTHHGSHSGPLGSSIGLADHFLVTGAIASPDTRAVGRSAGAGHTIAMKFLAMSSRPGGRADVIPRLRSPIPDATTHETRRASHAGHVSAPATSCRRLGRTAALISGHWIGVPASTTDTRQDRSPLPRGFWLALAGPGQPGSPTVGQDQAQAKGPGPTSCSIGTHAVVRKPDSHESIQTIPTGHPPVPRPKSPRRNSESAKNQGMGCRRLV